ncbi:Peptidyl-tRNA hydrolase protein 2, mitochondrial [Dermatophagoides pteronyssinus]|uniref:peptidyl-tRNA hydrolase n=1 Tax=Dermatophagoides pteronyssinus TaxID=6956 RepID=A0ABQ8JEW3_DERPT|nr:Peptidyl-tRNA hydrolase protein 2, mitochondrial [Dermatophagoides pteronyssinus]
MNVEDSWILGPILFGFVIGFRSKSFRLSSLTWRQKLVIVFNTNDVRRMNNTELLSNCSKISIIAFESSRKQTPLSYYLWSLFGQPKVVLQANSNQNLEHFAREASESMICSTILRNNNDRIILAIGPGPNHMIDKITGHLKLL